MPAPRSPSGPRCRLPASCLVLQWVVVDRLAVVRDGAAPERVELVAQRPYAGGVEPVDAPSSGRLVVDEARLFEHLQVLGDRRPADRQLIGEFAHGTWSFRQALEDGAPGGVTHRGPGAVHRSVS